MQSQCSNILNRGLPGQQQRNSLAQTVFPQRHGSHKAARSCLSTTAYHAVDDPVVTTDWLAKHLDQVSILDVRGHVSTELVQPGVEQSTYTADYDAYLEGHIPGAVFLDWTRDAIDTSSDVPVQLQQDADLLAAALEAKGVSSDNPVVAYDSGDGMMAARLWWMLTVAGHPSAMVMEGGWKKWRAEGRPTELYEPCMLKVYGEFSSEMQPQLRTTIQDLQHLPQLTSQAETAQEAQQQLQDMLLLDTRNMQQYTGQVRRGPRGGHIPGAVSLPRGMLLDEQTECFTPLTEQMQLLEAAGVVLGGDSQQQVVLYCNGGVAACTAALALHRLGHRRWSVYDGSWNEWSRSDLPVQ